MVDEQRLTRYLAPRGCLTDAAWYLLFPSVMCSRSLCHTRTPCAHRHATCTPPPPPVFLRGWHFAVCATKAEVIAVPTEFDTLLDYQKVLSRLVLKETLAGLQQSLGSKDSHSTVQVAGNVSFFSVFVFLLPHRTVGCGAVRCGHKWGAGRRICKQENILSIAIVKRHFLAKRARAAVGRTTLLCRRLKTVAAASVVQLVLG